MIELKSSFVCCVENDAGNHNFKPGLYENPSKMNNIDSLHPIEPFLLEGNKVFCFFFVFFVFEREKR